MFKDERRGSHWPLAAALCGLWLISSPSLASGEEGSPGSEQSSDVVIATDMEEPAEFVPHEEQALDLDLSFGPDAPFGDEEELSPEAAPVELESPSPLAQPRSLRQPRLEVNEDPTQLFRQPNALRDAEPEQTPAERAETRQAMQQAHMLAKVSATSDEYAAVIDFCRDAEEETNWTVGRRYFRRLASWAHNRRGEEHARKSQASAAVADFHEALKLDPQNWRAAHNRGVSRAEQGQLAASVADFSYVISLQPDYGPAYRNRGEVYFATARYAEAVEDYTKALSHMSETGDLHYLRATALHELGQLREALADYDAALGEDAKDPQRLVGRATVRAELDQYAAAIADLEHAIRLDPKLAEAHRAIGWILATCPDERYRRPEKALLAARRALELQGRTDPGYFDTLAAAYAAAEDYGQAAATQQQAVRLASGEAEQQTFRTRLALYHQRRSYVSGREHSSTSGAPHAPGTNGQATAAPEPARPPAGRGRTPRAAGLRQPLRSPR